MNMPLQINSFASTWLLRFICRVLLLASLYFAGSALHNKMYAQGGCDNSLSCCQYCGADCNKSTGFRQFSQNYRCSPTCQLDPFSWSCSCTVLSCSTTSGQCPPSSDVYTDFCTSGGFVFCPCELS